MYSFTSNRTAPQVTFAKRPIVPVSIWKRFAYIKPIDRLFSQKDGQPTFVPSSQ